jgi:HEAT repeat protein
MLGAGAWMRGRALFGFSFFFVAISALGPAAAGAQDVALDPPIAMLRSASHDELLAAIRDVSAAPRPEAVAPLVARIREGLPPDLLEAAVDALAALASPEAAPVLADLATHRRPAIRLRAVRAIAACHAPDAERVLVPRLQDSSADVRAAAAAALADVGTASSADVLFAAFDRDVPGSGAALAHVARDEHVARILGYLERRPFSVMREILAPMLARRDLSNASRLEIVSRVSELASPDARAFLEAFVAAQPRPRDAVARAAAIAAARLAQ